jgi:SAM-dependent methyltransferase
MSGLQSAEPKKVPEPGTEPKPGFNELRYGNFILDGHEFLDNDRMRIMLGLVRGLIREGKAKRILDVGCTDGFMSMLFKEMGLYTVGVDASESAVAMAIAKGRCDEAYDEAYVANLDGHPLPMPEASVDLIWAGEIIEHIFSTENFARELFRVSSPGGRLIISTPNLASWINRLIFPLGLQPFFTETGVEPTNSGNFLRQVSMPAGHIRIFTLSALRHLLTGCGWIVEKAHGASILEKRSVKRLDLALSHAFPALATDMILVCRKPG